MIFILNRNLDVVGVLNNDGDISKITPFFDDEFTEDLTTGSTTFECSTLGNTKESEYLQVGNYVAFKDDAEGFQLLQITETEDEHGEQLLKHIYCEGVCLELLNEVLRPITMQSVNVKQALTTILNDTKWSIGNLDATLVEVGTVEISDYTNVFKAIQDIIVAQFGAEIKFRVDIKNNKVVGKYIDVFAERGRVTNHRFEYGVNLSQVKKTMDTSELCTALIGVGKDGITFKDVDASDKPKNQDFITSDTAYRRWSNNGSHIIGVFKSDTESVDELLKLTREELKRRSNPKISYEVDVETLGEDVRIGDTVHVIDTEFTPPILLSARVSKLSKSRADKTAKCILANFKEVTSKIKDNTIDASINSLKAYLENMTTGKITDEVIEQLRRFLAQLNLNKKDINYIMDKVLNSPHLDNIQGDTFNRTLKHNTKYVCGVMKSLTFKLPSNTEEKPVNKDYVTTLTFTTPHSCEPMYFYQSNMVWLEGADCISGALLQKADTKYKITIQYDGKTLTDRTYKGTVTVLHRGTGKYTEPKPQEHREKLLEFAKSYYDKRDLFKYNTTTPVGIHNNGGNPATAENVARWFTGGKYHIDCSTFVNQIYRARGYSNSIYKNLDYPVTCSTKYGFGIDIGRTASDQARTCVINGWHLDVDINNEQDWWKLQEGDLVFWSARYETSQQAVEGRFMQVGHVGIIRTPKTSSGKTTTYEVTHIEGSPYCILNRTLQENHPDKLLFFARPRRY